MKNSCGAFAILFASTLIAAQTAAPGNGSLTRRYHEGEALTYRMTAVNEDWHYTAEAAGLTKKTPSGAFVEEFRWTGMTSNGQQVTLSPAAASLRQTLSLDPAWTPSGPDLSNAEPNNMSTCPH